jgi:hypothetical protein
MMYLVEQLFWLLLIAFAIGIFVGWTSKPAGGKSGGRE